MGTRADFYLKSGETLTAADWLGSIAWDGYPDHKGWVKTERLLPAKTEDEFRAAVDRIAAAIDHFTSIDEGWPWPWEDSRTTDYAYVFDVAKGRVVIYCFGHEYPESASVEYEWPDDDPQFDGFPDMRRFANVQLGGKKSGLIVITARGVE